MILDDFLNSRFKTKSIDRFRGRGNGTLFDPSMKIDRYSMDYEKLLVARASGKRIWCVDSGCSGARAFFGWVINNNPSAVIDLGADDCKRIEFDEGFSLYAKYWPGSGFGYGIDRVFMDVREVIFPVTKTVEYGDSRIYVLSKPADRYDLKSKYDYYYLPYLKYPKIMVPFIKYLREKGIIGSKYTLWNKDVNIYDASGKINMDNWMWTIQTGTGVPIKNIKTEDDIEAYKIWIRDTLSRDIQREAMAYIGSARIVPYCPVDIEFKKIDIDQSIIDDYVSEARLGVCKIIR